MFDFLCTTLPAGSDDIFQPLAKIETYQRFIWDQPVSGCFWPWPSDSTCMALHIISALASSIAATPRDHLHHLPFCSAACGCHGSLGSQFSHRSAKICTAKCCKSVKNRIDGSKHSINIFQDLRNVCWLRCIPSNCSQTLERLEGSCPSGVFCCK